jgi:hypothetical protein
MMNRRNLLILGGALVALIGISLLTSKARYSTARGGGFADVLETKPDTGQIQTIKAWIGDKPDSSVVLERSGEGWTIPSRYGWKAKNDLVQQLLDELAGLKGEIRSSKAEVLPDYQIDDQNGLHVVAASTGGAELFHLVAGKSAAQGGSFVRREGSNDVFMTSSSLRSTFGVWGDEPRPPDAKRWINLEVHKAERNDVDRIVLRSKGEEIVLQKEFAAPVIPPPAEQAPGDTSAAPPPPSIDRSNWTWKKDSRGEIDKGKADSVLGTLCSLYAAEVADPAKLEEYGFGPQSRVAEVTFVDGRTTKIEFGKEIEDGKKVIFRVDGGMPAEIYKSSVDRIFQSRKELSPQKK